MAILSVTPNSDENVVGTWTGSAGTRYTVIDDHPDAAGADELRIGTIPGNLTFGFAAISLPAGSTINSVTLKYYDYATTTGVCNFGGRLKVGGNYYNATTHQPNTTRTLQTDTWTTNPATSSAWTYTDITDSGSTNGLQAFGYVSSDANPTVNTSSIVMEIDYTEGTGSTVKRTMWMGSAY